MNVVYVTTSFIFSLLAVLMYKFLVHEEPWAIGMTQVFALSIILALLHWYYFNLDKTKEILKQFFTGKDSPINIAVFRIVFFGWLFFTTNGKQLLFYSEFPKELQFAPMGMGWLLPHLPISQPLAATALVVFKVACFLAMIGLLTRVSTLIAAVVGFYVIGVPQFYGSVAHNHHLFWFLVIFSASRCSDVLSVDAILKGFKKADLNQMTPPEPSNTYALPLRFIWILMGLCYFFPGFWKLWNSGNAWILGDNLKYHMFYNWMGFDGWLPAFRIDQYPWLCHIGGAAVIFFEISFIFFVFVPYLRYFLIFEGLMFHNMTNLLMNINFYVLQICYSAFVNWNAVFRWCGQKLFSEEMVVLYDGNCSFCRRAVAFVQVFNVLGRIRFLDLYTAEAEPFKQSHRLSQEDLMFDMHGFIGTKMFKGFMTYKEIATRIPLFWSIRPLLSLPPVQTMGNRIYRKVADSRTCLLVPKTKMVSPHYQSSDRILIIVGSILIVGNLYMGFIGKGSGWPFACYPTFSEIAWDRFRSIECQILYPDASERTIRVQSLKSKIPSYRIRGLMSKIFNIKDESTRNKKFMALWQVLAATDPDLVRAESVRFYFIQSYTDPAKRHLNPVKKKLVFEFKLKP